MKLLLLALLAFAGETRKWEPPPKPEPPPSAQDYFARARAHMRDKRWKLAEEALEAARAALPEKDPGHVLYFERRGAIAYRNHERKRAKEYYTQAIKLANELELKNIHAADAFEGLGRLLLDEGKPDYALKFLQRAFDIAPTRTTAELIERASSKRPRRGQPER